MMHMSIIHPKIGRQHGVTIVTAIFLVVVLSLMGLGMITLLTTSQQSVSQEITSAKTYMAGRSCLQWGMYQAVFSPGTATGTHTISFNDTNSGNFNAQCTVAFVSFTSDGQTFYNLDITTSYGDTSSPEYSKRIMKLQFQP